MQSNCATAPWLRAWPWRLASRRSTPPPCCCCAPASVSRVVGAASAGLRMLREEQQQSALGHNRAVQQGRCKLLVPSPAPDPGLQSLASHGCSWRGATPAGAGNPAGTADRPPPVHGGLLALSAFAGSLDVGFEGLHLPVACQRACSISHTNLCSKWSRFPPHATPTPLVAAGAGGGDARGGRAGRRHGRCVRAARAAALPGAPGLHAAGEGKGPMCFLRPAAHALRPPWAGQHCPTWRAWAAPCWQLQLAGCSSGPACAAPAHACCDAPSSVDAHNPSAATHHARRAAPPHRCRRSKSASYLKSWPWQR